MSLQSCWKAAAVAAVADSLPTAAVAAVANSLPTAVAAAVADNLPRSIVWSWGDIDNPHTVWPIDLNQASSCSVVVDIQISKGSLRTRYLYKKYLSRMTFSTRYWGNSNL